MTQKEIKEILKKEIFDLNKYDENRKAKISCVTELNEYYLINIVILKKHDDSVVYGSGHMYAIDKMNKKYYYIHPMYDSEMVDYIIKRGRKRLLCRIKQIIMDIYSNRLSPYYEKH